MGAASRQQSQVRKLVWRFEAMGFTYEKAVNLAAMQFGMPPNDYVWSEDEIAELLFLKEARRRGRLPS
jgi:hypothetical protein